MTSTAMGLDFGTTNTVVALGSGPGAADVLSFPHGDGTRTFRSALCFWADDDGKRAQILHEAGPWAIDEYLAFPQDSRFIQSFKSVAASKTFEHATVFEKRLRFEELLSHFLDKLIAHGGLKMPERIVIGRPVQFAGSRPDEALALERYGRGFATLGAREIAYVYEPLAAAFSFARQVEDSATILIADFGGGTSDFSVVRVNAPGTGARCTPLGHAGVGIAGDRFDYRIVDRLVLPLLGKGGFYRSFDKHLEIPRGYFADFADWSRLALMRNRRTLEELRKLAKSAVDPTGIERMIRLIELELGFPLYDAVGRLKRELSGSDTARFQFSGGGIELDEAVDRTAFEDWITPDLAEIGAAADRALAAANTAPADIDRVFLTGGSSLVPAVRQIFIDRFGEARVAGGEELTSIAHGLALVGQEPDMGGWTA
ncbi:Hsp70 family protein [Sphingoaurantiacus capsulatus]|uniref:Hsp70 family protein n=1 Tax=Sphingoaurantiacus capsulatus TaxID=1771310 RepID=A0ABV7X6Z4_9SPHN